MQVSPVKGRGLLEWPRISFGFFGQHCRGLTLVFCFYLSYLSIPELFATLHCAQESLGLIVLTYLLRPVMRSSVTHGIL